MSRTTWEGPVHNEQRDHLRGRVVVERGEIVEVSAEGSRPGLWNPPRDEGQRLAIVSAAAARAMARSGHASSMAAAASQGLANGIKEPADVCRFLIRACIDGPPEAT